MYSWVFFLIFKTVFVIGNYICNPRDYMMTIIITIIMITIIAIVFRLVAIITIILVTVTVKIRAIVMIISIRSNYTVFVLSKSAFLPCVCWF